MDTFRIEKNLECLYSILNMLSNMSLDSAGNMRPDMIQLIGFIKSEFLDDIYLDIQGIISMANIDLNNFLDDLEIDVIKKANLKKFTSGNMIPGMLDITSLSSSKNTVLLQNQYKINENLKITVKRILTIFKNLHQYDSQWPQKFNFPLDILDVKKNISDRVNTIIKKTIESAKRKVQKKLQIEIINEISEIQNTRLINISNFDIKDVIMNSERIKE